MADTESPTYVDATARVLGLLQKHGEISYSSCGARARKRIAPLIDAGVLNWYAVGSGWRIRVERRADFARWCDRTYPEGLFATAPPASRAEAVGRFRDAKRTPRAKTDWILVRGISTDPFVHPRHGTLDIRTPSRMAGGIAVELAEGETRWYHPGPVVTVENLEMLPAIEQLIPETALAIYTRGRASQRLIDWLVALCGQGVSITYAGDYDIAGLVQYQRLRRSGVQASMWIPPDLEGLFRDYGNTSLVDAQSDMAERYQLRSDEDTDVRAVLELIERYNAGLEQEACLLRRQR